MTIKNNIEEIYQEYYQKVFSYINYRINSFHDAEDITEDVFVKVVNKIDTFDESKASLSTWIFNIARNTLIDHYRTNHENMELIDNYDYFEEESGLGVEDLDTLTNAIKHLSKEEQEIIVLRYYEDYSLKEIAQKMNLSYGVTKLRHNHALKQIEKEYGL